MAAETKEVVGLATEQAKEAVISAQEYVKLKVQELQDLKHEIEAKRALGSDEEKAASITEFHEKVMIIQHEIAQTVEQANTGVQRAITRARSSIEDAPRSLQRTVTQVERELMQQDFPGDDAHVIEMGNLGHQGERDLIKSAPSNGSGRSMLDVQESGYSTSSESAPLIQQQTKQASRFANQASQQNVDMGQTASREIRAALDSDD
ncbi:hypothetical protein WJX74_007084 [Apatococcus lobatus]|uniref:Uncharacterized protein n=2 Tax=Apatococcus TaxID=904362 RepID=A0AAW1RP07_9CHLO